MKKIMVLSLMLIGVQAWAEPINVLSSFSILGDVTQQLGGNRVKVNTLIGANQDAHTYQMKAQDVKKIQDAKLIVLNGLQFERADIRRATQNSGKKIINATQGIQAMPMPEHDHEHGHEGHDHGAFDPHAWHDPVLMKTYANNITNGLIAIDPQGKSYYQQRLQQYQQQLDQLHTWAQQQFASVPVANRKAMTAHHSFGYLGQRYRVTFYAPQGVSTSDAASAATVATLIKQIKQDRIRALFVENMVNPRIVQQIARETGAKTQGTLYADALSSSAPANTYLGLMRHNVSALVQAMK